jgi:hypothetical protein
VIYQSFETVEQFWHECLHVVPFAANMPYFAERESSVATRRAASSTASNLASFDRFGNDYGCRIASGFNWLTVDSVWLF